MASEFRPSRNNLENSVISALTWDLPSEVAQFVEASRTFFFFQSIFLIGPPIAIIWGSLYVWYYFFLKGMNLW